jgi:hypothetical protein
MATDLLPLVIAVLPDITGGGCGGSLPVGTQMLVLGAALLATGQRILVLMTDIIPQVCGLLYAILKYIVWAIKALGNVVTRQSDHEARTVAVRTADV